MTSLTQAKVKRMCSLIGDKLVEASANPNDNVFFELSLTLQDKRCSDLVYNVTIFTDGTRTYHLNDNSEHFPDGTPLDKLTRIKLTLPQQIIVQQAISQHIETMFTENPPAQEEDE